MASYVPHLPFCLGNSRFSSDSRVVVQIQNLQLKSIYNICIITTILLWHLHYNLININNDNVDDRSLIRKKWDVICVIGLIILLSFSQKIIFNNQTIFHVFHEKVTINMIRYLPVFAFFHCLSWTKVNSTSRFSCLFSLFLMFFLILSHLYCHWLVCLAAFLGILPKSIWNSIIAFSIHLLENIWHMQCMQTLWLHVLNTILEPSHPV